MQELLGLRISSPSLRAYVGLAVALVCLGTPALAQDFEETWKEFLAEDKVVRVSKLARPNPSTDPAAYNKFLLIYTNNDFCSGEVASAEERLAEMHTFPDGLRDTLPGFTPRMRDLETKIAAYHTIDDLWADFLEGRSVDPTELATVEGAERTCEKASAAKYSFMMAQHHLCEGDEAQARKVFEGRVLLLTDKTTLDVDGVVGLRPRVEDMRHFFALLPKLDTAWEEYLSTGRSPGFEGELPTYDCYVTPKIKELILRGGAAPCEDGAEAMEEIASLQSGGGRDDRGVYSLELESLAELVEENTGRRESLERAWEHFVEHDEVDPSLPFGLEYCEPEPLIRAHILIGYTFPCDLAEVSIRKVDSIRAADRVAVSSVARGKLRELATLRETYEANGVALERAWALFVANGDSVAIEYTPTEEYCDMIQQAKDYTMQGLTGDCNDARLVLEEIDDFTRRFDFKLGLELECRVQKLRVRLWECRFAVVDELARLEAATQEGVTYEDRLASVMAEYDMRPEDEPAPAVCEEVHR